MKIVGEPHVLCVGWVTWKDGDEARDGSRASELVVSVKDGVVRCYNPDTQAFAYRGFLPEQEAVVTFW